MGEVHFPQHVGIIMDGNGRWAKKRGLPRIAGHKQGASVFGRIARHAAKTPVKYLTVYAFSTENWKRPKEEVAGIMELLREFLKDSDKYKKDNIRVRVIGDIAVLDGDIRRMIANLEEASKEKDGLVLNIAVNYGGRGDILQAARAFAADSMAGFLKAEQLDEALFSKYLYTKGMPDADLIIRTSGEMRVSNFLLWQAAYAEYIFSDVLWPDFTARHFDDALIEFSSRNRRLGNI